MARAFVIRPFGTKTDSGGQKIQFEEIHAQLIKPALQANDLAGDTTGEIIDSGNIREDMFALILEADLVICDISIHNANVFYELGIRHALRKKRTILIKGMPEHDAPPFDVLTDRYLAYQFADPAAACEALTQVIAASLRSDRETDSPIFKMLPTLPEADPATVQVVPRDFSEEVERALAAESKGWLRLLSQDVRGRRFQWEGLRLVAKAQWDLKDYPGAQRSWEAIREVDDDDVKANLALANIYERMYRSSKQPELLARSDQAIQRVLASSRVNLEDRVEALALKGRNQKTEWRRKFESTTTLEERREDAMTRALCASYEAYRQAFAQNLNHFYSGLNAVQMGTIFLELIDPEGSWKDAFEDDEQAEKYAQKLRQEIADLRVIVRASIDATIERIDSQDANYIWALISQADLLFLTEEKERRVLRAYQQTIDPKKLFAWDATRSQLLLFESLGIHAQKARYVLNQIDLGTATVTPEMLAPPKPQHILLFAGHRVDTPSRTEARFPTAQEHKARQLIQEKIIALHDKTYQTLAIASAAPGSDILFHEVCGGLGIPSQVCLPMPPAMFVQAAFQELDEWRSRFLDLQNNLPVLVLSDLEGLPRWLQGTTIDAWERGNRWVLEIARASGAARVTLVALWDHRELGDAPGGTAHMLQIARNAGDVYIETIDSRELFTTGAAP